MSCEGVKNLVSYASCIVDHYMGQAFTNPEKLYTDLSTGVLDALNNKTAVIVGNALTCLVPVLIGVILAKNAGNVKKKATDILEEAQKSPNIKKREIGINLSHSLRMHGNLLYVWAACSQVGTVALLYLIASSLRQNGSIIASQLTQ